MNAYKIQKGKWKIEATNCVIVVTEGLRDIKGRSVTSIQINPDKYAGEYKNVRIGGCANVRVITLKTKRN